MFGRKCLVLVVFLMVLFMVPLTVFSATKEDKDALLSEISNFIDKKPEIISNVVYSIADEYSRGDKIDESIALFEKALKVTPDDDGFLNRLGDLYSRKGDQAKVIEIYKKLTTVKPDNVWYFQRLSDAYKNADKNDEAVLVWEDLLKTSKNAEVFMQAANFYSGNDNMDKAIEAAKKAVEFGTENSGYLQNLESFYIRAEKFDEAEAVCKKALLGAKEEWMKDWANSELINIYQRQDKLTELAVIFEKDLTAAPNDISQYKKLADLYQRSDDRLKAIEVYEKAVSRGVTNRDIDNRLLDMYEWAENFDKAEAKIREIMAASPEDNYLYERLANLLSRADKKDQAKKAWQEFLAKVPNDAGVVSRYGDRLNEWGDVNGAIEQYRKAQTLDVNNLWYTMRVADLLLAGNKNEEAKKELGSIITSTADEWMKQNAEAKIKDIEAIMAPKPEPIVIEETVAVEPVPVVVAPVPVAQEEVALPKTVEPEIEKPIEKPKEEPKKKKKSGWFSGR